jgi:hypothetical protein
MWSRLYRNHFIMAFPSFDTMTNRWVPQADITWGAGPSRDSQFVRSPNRFTTEIEAVSFALAMGREWVDDRLSRSGRGLAEHGQVADMMEALKDSLNKTAPKQSYRAQTTIDPGIEKAFTFEQFKSALAHRGIKVSEQTLKKSYAALVKLRQNKRLSWAEARWKVEHSHEKFPIAQGSIRRPRTARLPLTERDWRRLG